MTSASIVAEPVGVTQANCAGGPPRAAAAVSQACSSWASASAAREADHTAERGACPRDPVRRPAVVGRDGAHVADDAGRLLGDHPVRCPWIGREPGTVRVGDVGDEHHEPSVGERAAEGGCVGLRGFAARHPDHDRPRARARRRIDVERHVLRVRGKRLRVDDVLPHLRHPGLGRGRRMRRSKVRHSRAHAARNAGAARPAMHRRSRCRSIAGPPRFTCRTRLASGRCRLDPPRHRCVGHLGPSAGSLVAEGRCAPPRS